MNLSIKTIYQALCPKCKDKLVRLIAKNPNLEAIKKQLEAKDA